MFERFTRDARAVVRGAVGHAECDGATVVDAGHVLLALFDQERGRASFALAALGARDRRDAVERALADARRRGGLSRADADALAGLGIDLSEVVSRVEEAHGVGALTVDGGGRERRDGRDREEREKSGRRGWRRPFAREAKETLEKSLRIAVAKRDRHIGDEHILLALLARSGICAEVLADHGVTYEAVDRVLFGGGEAMAG